MSASVHSKPYQASYFITGRYMGSSTFTAPFVPRSMAYFCATCGDIWARIHVEQGEQEPYWEVCHVPCDKHKVRGVIDWAAVPGSLLSSRVDNKKSNLAVQDWARAIEHLPPEVLRREFDVNLKWYDQQQLEKDD